MTKSLRELTKSIFKVGLFGFGGGLGMLALLRTECVRKKQFITDDDLCTAVALGQMLPGPFVPNYCEYIGYHLYGIRGAVAAGAALIVPSFILMIILSWFYLTYQTLPGIALIFKGIGAVITSIILWASFEMGRVLIKSIKGVLIFFFALTLFLLKFDPVLTVIISGLLGIAFEHMRFTRSAVLAVPLFLFDLNRAAELFGIFTKIGAVIFGGGYGAIPFIQNEVCTIRNWLTAKEFVDAVALGQMTPGPVAITATFIGFKVMGIPGALVATLGIFLPSFLMLLILVRIYRKISTNKYVNSFFNGIKSAVVAILLSTGVFFVLLNWQQPAYAVFGIAALFALLFLKIEPIFLILAGAVFSFIAR
ncbi:MAG: chromate efflux transporter [candidate division WOR-3 bacterium]|nr:MAG: chromate efflux transporter [candidate division WOR-3 bacterium]